MTRAISMFNDISLLHTKKSSQVPQCATLKCQIVNKISLKVVTIVDIEYRIGNLQT